MGPAHLPQATEYFVTMLECLLKIGVQHLLPIRALTRSKFGCGIVDRIAQTPLSYLAQQRASVPGCQRQRSKRSVSDLRQASRDSTTGFAVRIRTEDHYAHSDASSVVSTWRVSRCSSMSASARNLPPQLMNRIGWYLPQIGNDPATPPTTPRRPLNGSSCFNISFILRAALR